mgnify:CR=1 FL=1
MRLLVTGVSGYVGAELAGRARGDPLRSAGADPLTGESPNER